MTDTTPSADTTAETSTTVRTDGFVPITSQEAADAYVAAHLPEDYTKALEEHESLTSRLADAERRLLAAQVAAETGVPAEALTGSTREELEAAAKVLRDWRDQTAPKPKPAPLRRPGLHSGASASNEQPSAKAAAAAALRRMRGAD